MVFHLQVYHRSNVATRGKKVLTILLLPRIHPRYYNSGRCTTKSLQDY